MTESEKLEKWQDLSSEFRALGIELQDLISETEASLVFKGKQTKLAREVAVKVLSNLHSETAYARFERESKLLAASNQEQIVQLYSAGKLKSGRPYMVMEYLSGEPLSAVILRRGHLEESEIRRYASQICSALKYAHEHSIIHRDIKPANVILNEAEQSLKLIDFGIFKELSQANSKLTQTGSLPGTAAYMSPEQCKNEAVDQRSDIYSLGCLLYELAVGKPPFADESEWMVLSNHLNKEINKIPAESISRRLEEIILKCLKKSPSDRWQSAGELQLELEKAAGARSKKPHVHFLKPAAIVIVMFLVAAFVAKEIIQVKQKREASLSESVLYKQSWRNFEKELFLLNSQEEREKRSRRWLFARVNDSAVKIDDLISCLDSCGVYHLWSQEDRKLFWILAERCRQELDHMGQKQDRDVFEEAKVLELEQRCQLSSFKMDKARETLDSIMDLNGDRDPSLMNLLKTNALIQVLNTYGAQNQYEEARSCWLKYKARLNGAESTARLDLTMSQISSIADKPDEAMQLLNDSVLNYKLCTSLGNYDSLIFLCIKLNSLQRSPEVVDIGKLLYVSNPGSQMQKFAMQYIFALLQTGKLEEAKEVLENIESFPETSRDKITEIAFRSLKLLLAMRKNESNNIPEDLLESLLDRIAKEQGSNTFFSDFALEETGYLHPENLALMEKHLASTNPLSLAAIYTNCAHRLRTDGKNKLAISLYLKGQKYFEIYGKPYPGRIIAFLGEAKSRSDLKDYSGLSSCIARAKALARGPESEFLAYEIEALEADTQRDRGDIAGSMAKHKHLLEVLRPQKQKCPDLYARMAQTVAWNYLSVNDLKNFKKTIAEELPLLNRTSPSSKYYAEQMELLQKEQKAKETATKK